MDLEEQARDRITRQVVAKFQAHRMARLIVLGVDAGRRSAVARAAS